MPSKKTERILETILVVAALLTLFLCGLLVHEYRRLHSLGGGGGSLLSMVHAHGPLTASDASRVESWMTFSYINRVFSLPPAYLETSLSIRDTRYPRLTIEEYAEDQHLSEPAFLTQIQTAIRAYFTPAS